MGSHRLNEPIVAMAPTHDGRGYWLVAADGGIFAFGDATFEGSLGSSPITSPIANMTPTPDNEGYWLLSQAGTVYGFGDAGKYGSGQGIICPRDVARRDTGGWLLGPDCGGRGTIILAMHQATVHRRPARWSQLPRRQLSRRRPQPRTRAAAAQLRCR